MVTFNKNIIGHGYNESMMRVEHRPAHAPHTQDELIEILDILQNAGVEAWWYSVSAKGSYPLFPSKVLPYKQDVAVDYLPWLVEEAHKRDIVLFSWEYLNTSPLLMEEHPDWRVKYLNGPEIVGEETERHGHFACFNSPYGELLKEFCVEVVNTVGFDGIWFDGCYLFGPASDGFRWSCCCERCAKKFKDDTGFDMPHEIDWGNIAFDEYLKWRYRTFTEYWRELSGYVRSKNKTALIAYNFFNRHYMGAVSGSPLEHQAMDALIVGEGTVKTVQMQIKTLRAVNNAYPPEIWTHLFDGVKLAYPSRPNPEPASNIFFAQAAATAGGYASFGVGLHPRECAETLKDISSALAPLSSVIGGESVKMCALLFSGMTKDFACSPEKDAKQFSGKNKAPVDNVYGMGFLLNALHYPFDIVLDNQLDALEDYRVLILPDVQCMDDSALHHLTNYVENGGVIVAIGECGTKTSFGKTREYGILDSLLGVKLRYGNLEYCVMEPTVSLLKSSGLPEKYMISGRARLVEVEDNVEILAYGRMFKQKTTVANHDKQVDEQDAVEVSDLGTQADYGAAVFRRQVGNGQVITISPAIGLGYSQNPNRRSRELFSRLLMDVVEPPYQVTASANIVVTAWYQDDGIVFHILNQPTSMISMVGTGIALSPEDFIPTGSIVITLPGNYSKAISVYEGVEFDYVETENRIKVTLYSINQHVVIKVIYN